MAQIFNPDENERFLNLYRQLEQLQSTSPATARYIKQRFYDQIETYRKLRNYLSHEQYQGQYPFCVSSTMCDDLEKIIGISKTKAYDIASKNIAFATPDHTLSIAKEAIQKWGYSYLPILDSKRRVLGVITPLSLLRFEGEYDKKISQNLDEFVLEKHPKRLIFVSRNTYAHSVMSAFNEVKEGKRVGLAFVTEKGKPEEALLGVISPLDAISFLQEGKRE